MAWTVFGQEFLSADLTTSARFQPVIMNTNTILKAIRTWIIVVDDPTFTDLNCKIFSSEVVSSRVAPKKLLHTSTNVITKTAMITENNGAKEIFFEFDDVALNGNDTYNFVINGTGYAPVLGSKFLAWMQGFPDPVYRTGLSVADISLGKINRMPYTLYCVGGDF